MIEIVREDVVTQANTQVELRAEAHSKQGMEKHAVHEARKANRPAIRAALLAYGFLRGRTYAAVERTTASSAEQVHRLVLAHYPSLGAEKLHVWLAGQAASDRAA